MICAVINVDSFFSAPHWLAFKKKKIRSDLMFLGDIERDQWHEIS